MQASLEAEIKGRAEALKVRKKLESDINELEIALDQANRANCDAQRNMKKYQVSFQINFLFSFLETSYVVF